MANQVLMQFVSATGTYTFNGERMPLFSRRVEFTRPTDQGHGGRKIVCTLSGFIEGLYHQKVIEQYKALINVLKANDAKFTYKGDNSSQYDVMVDQRVYIDDYAEPTDWKSYQGDYNIVFHYFEQPNFTDTDLGIRVIFTPSAREKQDDEQKSDIYDNQIPTPYTFDPPPLWDFNLHVSRENWRGPRTTYYGKTIANEIGITLTGRLYADDYAGLKTKIDLLQKVFGGYDGQLSYGSWTNNVRIEDVRIPTVFPRNYCDYQILMRYDTTGVKAFKCRRRLARLHNYPKITELPWCNTVRVQQFAPLGQTVNYYFYIKAVSIAQCYSLLANEAQAYVTPGGIELEGGTCDEDEQEMSLTVSFQKYYREPIKQNTAGT